MAYRCRSIEPHELVSNPNNSFALTVRSSLQIFDFYCQLMITVTKTGGIQSVAIAEDWRIGITLNTHGVHDIVTTD